MIKTASLIEEYRKSKKKMKDDDEIDSLLGEIPRAISFNHHHDQERPCIMNNGCLGMYNDSSTSTLSHNSPVSGFSLQSDGDGSSSSLLSSNGHSLSDHGSPTNSPIEELKPHAPVWMDAIDELGLSRDLSGMYISEQPQFYDRADYGAFGFDFNQFSGSDYGCGNNTVNSQFLYTRRHQNIRPISTTEALPYVMQNGAAIHAENVMHYHQQIANAYRMLPSHVKLDQRNLSSEESLIMQGGNVSFKCRFDQPRHNVADHVNACQGKRPFLSGSFSVQPPKCNTLAEARGYIYCLAKDQHGCRFLQRMFDEGTTRDVRIIFNEVIHHVVELMMNPFGNYLMQKLLEVCNEDQRMQILLRVTAKPGELIRISLNTHGTRVVQKLIETLKSRQQIALVIRALEPGFLALIKDLNGNHVVQRCLQCLSHEDSKFIFHAAAKYCVDIATHQHGCCVLQRCITHSDGEHRDRLIAEISANALQLSQDAFGNYVVQFILELKMPSATNKLISEFEGNYVHLSTQKFSSHVVEKCLITCYNNVRSNIIHELLASNHFEHLLQDPHANYVVQTALKVCEGSLHNILVEAIESHKAMSRNSPYSKRIFSHKLLKK